MTEFSTPIDVCNRALDYVGQKPIISFSDNAKAAALVGRVYDKLRRAEMERNLWVFTIKRAWLYPVSFSTKIMLPAVWSAATPYAEGALVEFTDPYGNTNTWYSTEPNNMNNTPGLGTGGAQGLWQPFFGSTFVNQFIPQTDPPNNPPFLLTYNAGDVAYLPSGGGQNQAYLSLTNGNSDIPNVAEVWQEWNDPFAFGSSAINSAGRVIGNYNTGDVVQGESGYYWVSLIDDNQNNVPEDAPVPWNSMTTYASGTDVAGADGNVYQSLTSSNTGNNPLTDAVHWMRLAGQLVPWWPVLNGATGSFLWLPLDVTLSPPNIIYPLGAGPMEQSFTKNIYRLPENYLRRAPQDPRRGILSTLGAPSGLAPDDFVIEGKFLTTTFRNPIPLRYGANMTDVTAMSGLFCEALACRIASAICETLTQSAGKMRQIANEYGTFMRDARMVNAIENGPDEPPVDDFLVVRI